MKFKYEYMSMQEIGEIFGISAQKIGKELKKVGLRGEDGKPTQKAFDNNYVDHRCFQNSSAYPNHWNSEKVFEELQKNGLTPLKHPPEPLVERPRLITPLRVKSLNGIYSIYNSNNEEVMTVVEEKMANNLVYFLNEFMKFPNATKFFPQNQC